MSTELKQLQGAILSDANGQTGDRQILETALTRGHIKVLDLKTMSEHYVDWDGIRAQISAGTIRLIRSGNLSVVGHIFRTEADDKKEAELRLMIQAIKTTMQTKNVRVNGALEILQENSDEAMTKSSSLGTPIKLRSVPRVYELLDRDRKGLPLILGNAQKGNRTSRYTDEVRELIVRHAKENYLKRKSRYGLKKLTNDINDDAHGKGFLPADKAIHRNFVSLVIHQDITPDPEKARMDPKDAIAAKAVAKYKIRVGTPLQRVEQDGLHLPWWFKNEHGAYTGVYLVHAIDCCLSFPLGWQFVVGSPTSSTSLKCAQRFLFSKLEKLIAHGFGSDVDLYGTPSLIVFDNGPETKGQRLPRLTRLGISVLHCKARAAHGKPFIERLNRSLKEHLEHLPGCTRFDGVDGKRDPVAEGDDLMTLEEFESHVLDFYFKHWINQELKRFADSVFVEEYKGKTAAQRLQHFRDNEYALPLPPNLQEWQHVQYERDESTLQRTNGVRVRKYDFGGPNLEYLIKKLGETKVTVLVDPDDFRRVQVPVGDDFRLVELVNKDVDQNTPALSFTEADELKKRIIEDVQDKAIDTTASTNIFNAPVQARSTKTTPKRATKAESRETVSKTKAHEAVQRAAANPLTASDISQPLPTNSAAPDIPLAVTWSFDDSKVCPTDTMIQKGQP